MRFLKLPNRLFTFGKALEPMDLLVYCGIKSFCGRKHHTVVKGEKIADFIGVSRGSVSHSVQKLTALKLIRPYCRKQKHGKYAGCRGTNGYHFAKLTGGWTKIPYHIFSYGLNPSRFAAYAYLQSRKNHADRAFPSYAQIAAAVNIGERTAEYAVKELEGLFLVDKEHYIRMINRFGHNNYTLLDVLMYIVGTIKKKALRLISPSHKASHSRTYFTYVTYMVAYPYYEINPNRHQFYRKI